MINYASVRMHSLDTKIDHTFDTILLIVAYRYLVGAVALSLEKNSEHVHVFITMLSINIPSSRPRKVKYGLKMLMSNHKL